MMTRGIQARLGRILGQDVRISVKSNKVLSDGSFIDHTGQVDQVLDQIKSIPWIERVSYEKPYLNYWLVDYPIESKVKVDLFYEVPLRCYHLHRRLKEELMPGPKTYPEVFMPLIKKYNTYVITIEEGFSLTSSDLDDLFMLFKSTDLGYMYRRESHDHLRGILDLLDKLIGFVERKPYE